MSDTPRTDFVAHESGDAEWNRSINRFGRMMAHAQILERELAAANERAEKAEQHKGYVTKLAYDAVVQNYEAAERRADANARDAERYRFLRDSQDRATDSDWPGIFQDDQSALEGAAADEIIDRFKAKDAARNEEGKK